MKIILLLFVVASCYTFPTEDDWKIYKTKFSKTYSDHAEDLKHKEIFLRNKQFIEEHNKKYETGAVSYKVGLNQFSDWTAEEMNTQFGYRSETDNS